ncbi:MAG: response regulator, partial [Bacteroidales bacterium]|nr:response regulator [Bacteroidales bacterium]
MLHFRHSLVDSTTLSNDFAISICEDTESNIWIGTNNGLNRFIPDNNSFKRYGQNIGLNDNVINGLLHDDAGNIWIATNKGLNRYNDPSGRLKHYDYMDGLQSNEFSRGVCFRSNSGELYFGGIGGFNSFYPDQIKENKDKPPVVITDFKLFNMSVRPGERNSPLQKHISETEQITLSFRQSSFSFDFVALNYLNPEKNRYAYILEGYEDVWNQAGRIHTATYMNLPSGHYLFKVTGSNNDNIWNETGVSVGIKVLAPYYKHPVAFLIYAILIAGMIWLLINIVTYRQRKENEIRNERLEKVRLMERNQMRLQFFTNISHEFRTPLTLITGPLDKLIGGKTDHNKEYLFGLMRSNVNRMLRLVNQLLDFRKIENEKMPVHIRENDLDYLLSQIALGFEDLASRKMIELTYHPKSQNHEGKLQWYDEGIVDKVVYNLLSNAFKFTPEHGIIQLSLVLQDNMADIIVQDTGKGIAMDKLERIFERYYSESPEIYAGTGIGLSLSKRLIDIHGGEIKVESEIGKGSKFIVTIPVSKESFSAEEIVTEMEQVITNRPGLDMLKEEELYPGDHPNGQVRINKTLLVVEDNEELLKYLLDHFNEFLTRGAANGQEAYDWAVENIPDLIISDVMMPGMDGIELCKQIKENFITSHIPVILLTAKSDIEQKIEGLSVGADAYVAKPFDNDYLTALVKNLLAQRKMLREKFSENSNFIIEDEHITGFDKIFLDKIEAVIQENISDPDFSVEQVLSTVHMSRSQLYRKFKALINKNPSEYIRILRLKYAVGLLNQKQYSVNEIAYMSGFGNVSYFITCFKKYYGKSPRRYIESASE